MKKIPTLFVRDMNTRLVTPEITPGCEWVADGAGRPTVKLDGTCCLVRDGRLYKRHEVKRGGTPPPGFEPADHDEFTGKQQGWIAVGDGPEDRWHREAFGDGGPPDGTYELCGPKVQGNPERLERHVLIPHGDQECPGCPRTYGLLKAFFEANDMEGIVWHHPDGRMVKIKAKDLGLKRRPKAQPA